MENEKRSCDQICQWNTPSDGCIKPEYVPCALSNTEPDASGWGQVQENRKRLIDADLLLQWVEKLEAYNMGRVGCLKKPKGVTPEGVRHMIETMPKVDAVEVVHGRWKDKDWSGISINGYMACSACNVMIPKPDNNRYCLHYLYYCPNCGAKMDGGNENG